MDARYNPRSLEHRGLDTEAFKRSFLEGLVYTVGKDTRAATRRDWFTTSAYGVRDRLVDRWMETTRNYYKADAKRVYYLSLEFLIGRLMTNSLANLGVMQAVGDALDGLGLRLDDIIDMEPDAALGNGGLGRLAACFLDSMATLGLPGTATASATSSACSSSASNMAGRSSIRSTGSSSAIPGNSRGRRSCTRSSSMAGSRKPATAWASGPTSGSIPSACWPWRSTRLSSATAARRSTRCACGRPGPPATSTSAIFNDGDYMKAVEQKILSENLSRVLYPNDATDAGRELRLKQEYFFTSASLQDILRRYSQHHSGFDLLPEKAAIQLNDTHPAIGIAELMRLLVDKHALQWDHAWDITQRTFSYTNHTLLPEALEAWPVRLVGARPAAPYADHLRNQRPLPQKVQARRDDDRRPLSQGVADR